MEDIIKIKVDSGEAVAEIETVDSAMKKLDNTTQETTEATKSLKAQIREATQQLLEMSDEDPRRQKLIEDIGEMKDKMADAADQIKGNTGPAFESMGNTFGIMAGQLGNLDFDGLGKSLTQVGAAVGRINLKSLKQELGGFVQGLGSLGKALLTNPIFLIGTIIVGAIAAISANIGKIISYFPSIESALTGINDIDRRAAENAEKRYQAAKKNYEMISLTEQQMKYQGVSEREILNYKIKALETAIKEAETRFEMSKQQAKAQIEAAKSNYETTKWWVEQISFVIVNLLKGIDAIRQARGETSTLAEDFVNWGAKLFFDPAEVEKSLNDSLAEQETGLNQMKSDYFAFKNQLKEMDKKSADDRRRIQKETQEKEREAEKDHGEKMNAMGKDAKVLGEQQKTDIVLKAIADRHAQEEYEEDQKNKRLQEIQRQHMQNYVTIAGGGLRALGELVSAFNIKDEKRAKKQFQIMKSIQMASALIDTYKAITGALADTSPIPYYMKVANAAIAGATGFAQVAKIAQTQFNSPVTDGGGGLNGGTDGGGGGMQAPPIDFSFMQQTGQPNTVETYVLAGNVANALEARQKIIDQSHL